MGIWYDEMLDYLIKGLKLLEKAIQCLNHVSFGEDQAQAGAVAKLLAHLGKAIAELDEAKKGVKDYIDKVKDSEESKKQRTIDEVLDDNEKVEEDATVTTEKPLSKKKSGGK